MTFGNATDNVDAVARVKRRLEDDVGRLFQICAREDFYPAWLLCRSMFPIAESIAALLYGNTTNNTAANLSMFIRDDLGAIDPRYRDLSSTLCQVWRHGLTHHDEPPFLIVRPSSTAPLTFDLSTRAVSWSLKFSDPANHMTLQIYGDQTFQFSFSLSTFYEHLMEILNDQAKWSELDTDLIRDRYNEWSVKVLDHNRPNSEPGRAATEILNQLPESMRST